MSIFASDHTATIPIPFDAPHTAVIRKLPGKIVERAQADHMEAFTTGRRPRGWAGFFQNVLANGTASAKDAERAVRDPLAGFDRLTIVTGGLKAWSYKDGEKPKPVTPEAIADLDDEALEYFAVEIMKLTKPALFKTAEQLEADRKND